MGRDLNPALTKTLKVGVVKQCSKRLKKKIALIAHDAKEVDMIMSVNNSKDSLQPYEIIAR